MRNSKPLKASKITAGIMGLMMLVIVLFSAFYIAVEVNHDCTGEECPVCACIQQCENTLRGVGGGLAIQSSVIIPVLLVLIAVLFVTAAAPDTLFSRKVRLNN